MDFFDLLQNHIAAFLLMMTRISGLCIIAPFFGSQNIPVRLRVGLTFIMAMLLFPVIDQKFPVDELPPTMLGYMISVIGELFVGWLIGMVAYIVIVAINMAGKIMDMQVGFAMVNVMDPTTNQQNALIGSFLYNLCIIIFLVVNGHHMLLGALVGSFESIPMGGVGMSMDLSRLMIDFTNGIFLTGMKVALPVTFAILMINVALGVLARTMPQMNIFVIGIPMHLMIGVFVLMMLVPFYIVFLDVVFDEIYANVSLALHALQ